MLNEQLTETSAVNGEQDIFPWWRALSTHEITSIQNIGQSLNSSDTSFQSEPPQVIKLWEQTKVWAEGVSEISDILQVDPETFQQALLFAETATSDRFSEQPPDWELARRRWWERSSEGAEAAKVPYQGLMQGAIDELTEALETIIPAEDRDKGRLIRAAAMSLLSEPPVDDIKEITTRTLIQELHNRHGTEQPAGSFEELIGGKGFEQFLSSTYPVLTRIVVTRLLFWQARSIEFITHLILDRDRLERAGFLNFDGQPDDLPETSVIEEISVGAGDSHLEGRSVFVLKTVYGVLVYKPRGGTNEASLRRLRDLLFGDDHSLGFHVPHVIDCVNRSWHEFVDSEKLSSDEAPQAARSLGSLAAVVHLLGGNDFHHENVLFMSGRACPVDLETIIRVDVRQATQALDENADAAFRAVMDSVAVAGIVPGKIVSRTPDGSISATDISVVGYFAGQQTPMIVPTLGTDENGLPRIIEALAEDDGGSGEPLLKLHGEEFLDGFLETMSLCRVRVTLSSGAEELISCFDQAQLRYIPRPTMIYAKLLSESYHPFFLRVGTARDVVLAKAWNAYVNSPDRLKLVRAEYQSLLVGDIPHFSCSLDDRSLWDGQTKDALTVRDRLTERLKEVIDPENVEYQKRVIEQSFASIGAPIRKVATLAPLPVGEGAKRTARAIMKRALSGFREIEGTLAATTLIAASPAHWTVAPVGFEVYNGRAGILLANQRLHTTEPEDARFHDLLIRSVKPMGAIVRAGLDGDEAALRAMDVGAASSLAGWAACLANVPGLQSSLDVHEAARDVVDLLMRLIDQDKTFDVMSGSAGAIATALALRPLVEEATRNELIEMASRHLENHAEPAGPGLAWRDPETGQLLGGFSHGAAGIGTYLLAGALETGDTNARHLGQAAFRYDDSLFDSESLNWPDLRDGEHARSSMKAWCHGSPGALLARALSWDLLDDEQRTSYETLFDPISAVILEDIEASLLSTGADVLGDCLCHGRIGNLVILQLLSEASFLGHELQTRLDRAKVAAIDSLCSKGPRPGGLPGAPSPDLFMGLSGIAWGIDRLTTKPSYPSWDVLSFGLHMREKTAGSIK